MTELFSRARDSASPDVQGIALVVALLAVFTASACSGSPVGPPTTAAATTEAVSRDATASVLPGATAPTVPTAQATVQVVPSASPTAVPTTRLFSRPTAISVVPPSPTRTATPTASPQMTPTPIPPIDDRFGLIASGPARDWQIQNLGSTWFIDFDSDPGNAPAGTHKVPFIQVAPRTERITPERLATLVAGSPGSYWYIGGEPNVAQQGNMTPEAFVDEFDYYATEIRAADPSARIMGPSILNWDFTCTGCGGFTSGETWMRSFIDAYSASHGGDPPPVDVWSIDAYPLTWNTVPMTNWQIVRDQILGFRQYLADEVPGHSSTPIWVTELASHWAFSAWVIEDGALALPPDQEIEADYLWDEMEGYMDGILGWLKVNGAALNVERWFFFKGYSDLQKTIREGYAGIYFYEEGDVGAPLNQLGEVYGDYISGKR